MEEVYHPEESTTTPSAEASDHDEEDEEPSNAPTTYLSAMPSAGPTVAPVNTEMKNRMTTLEAQIQRVQESGKIAAEAAETMQATLDDNYKKVQETQDQMKESMDTMERSMAVMMTQLQESNEHVATVFEQTSKQSNTMMEMQITLANINRVLSKVTGYVNSQSDELHIPMDIGPQENALKRTNAAIAVVTQNSPQPKSTSKESGNKNHKSDGGKGN